MVRVVGFLGSSKVLFLLHAKNVKGIASVIAMTINNETIFFGIASHIDLPTGYMSVCPPDF